jgi:mannose-6-phosphate isomerase-like protein (cupin superfamily)
MNPKAALLAAMLLGPLPCLAQGAVAEPKTFISAADMEALIAKAKATMPVRPLISQPLIGTGGYRASLDYRAQTTPASLHDSEAELWVFVEGSGTFTLGGTLKDAKRTDPANSSGTAITGGTLIHVAKGDMLIVPAGVAHQVSPDPGTAVTMITMHVPNPPKSSPPK